MSKMWNYSNKQLYVRMSFDFGCRLNKVYDLLNCHDFWAPLAENERGTMKIKVKGNLKRAATVDIIGLDGMIHTEITLWKSPILNRFWVRLEDLF